MAPKIENMKTIGCFSSKIDLELAVYPSILLVH